MAKILKIKTREGEITFGDIDAEGEIPINIKTSSKCPSGVEISSASTIWISSSDLSRVGGHLLYLGKRAANGKD